MALFEMQWFGDSWGAPCNDPDLRVDTPIDLPCVRCRAPIVGGDRGFLLPHVESRLEGFDFVPVQFHTPYGLTKASHVTFRPFHLGCLLQSLGIDDGDQLL